MFSIRNTLMLRNADDASVAGKVSKKLRYKRKAETLTQAIGAVVTQLRTERDWSQAELADKSGYGRTWISQLETGKVNPSPELLIAFADTFKLKLSQLFSRAERKHSNGQKGLPQMAKAKKRVR